ncbi:NADH dehydrogenase (ubiquinone) PDSW subunit [Lasioglossum baleicum]|uniref:NADH dehydrogenase (ubiquinone) PDSW subunit n=1 Tax=Lasioglossum baleicum TaxID=434251 RepID=UPI003FCC5FBE
MDDNPNAFSRFIRNLIYIVDGPCTFVREKIVEPNQKKYPWYHQQFRRVPTIDTCHERDLACYVEANYQFKRDKMVDEEVLVILRDRYEHCGWENFEDLEVCAHLRKIYEDNATNYFIKYGDLGFNCNVRSAFMKQKHRMVWERRHGPVGSGMKEQIQAT